MGIIEAGGHVHPAQSIMGVRDQSPRLDVQMLNPKATVPTRAHPTDAGLDLYACESCTLYTNLSTPIQVATGIAVAIPKGLVGLVFVRSSLGFKQNVTLANSVGVIDSDYRGEVKVALHNQSNVPRAIKAGDRIAQLVLVPIALMEPNVVETLSGTDRGTDGIGSTGR